MIAYERIATLWERHRALDLYAPLEPQIVNFARAVEAEAYEAAAEACEIERVGAVCKDDDTYNLAIGHCAAAIRALILPP